MVAMTIRSVAASPISRIANRSLKLAKAHDIRRASAVLESNNVSQERDEFD